MQKKIKKNVSWKTSNKIESKLEQDRNFGISNFRKINNSTCSLSIKGKLKCWGQNNDGNNTIRAASGDL